MLRPTSPRIVPLVLVIPLLAVAGCRGCGERLVPAPRVAPAVVSSVPAELATLDLPELNRLTASGAEPPQIEAFVNVAGTGGAFVIRTTGGARLVRGRTLTPEYPGLDQVTISPDGQKVAFAVPQPDGKVRVVLDGKAGPPLDGAESLVFTRDGHLAYRGSLGERWHVVIDHVVGEARAAIGEPRVSRDGMAVIVAEQATPTAPFTIAAYGPGLQRKVLREFAAEDALVSVDGTRAAAIVAAAGKRRVRVFDLAGSTAPREGAPYDDVIGLAFDPGGEHVLYAARLGDRLHFVLDDKAEPLPAPEILETPVLNPARGIVGVVLAAGRPFFHLVFDREAPKAKEYDSMNDVVFSSDGSRYSYVAGVEGRNLVVVNGVEGPRFDRVVGPRFSPDGTFLVYRARQDGKRFVVEADAAGKVLRRHPEYEQILPVGFTPDGASVAYAVKQGPRLLWKVERLRPGGDPAAPAPARP